MFCFSLYFQRQTRATVMGPLGEVSSGSWGSSCPTCGRRTRCGCNSGYFSAFSSWPESGWSTSLCRSSTRKSVGDSHLFCHNFFSQNFYFLKFNFSKFTLSKHNLTKSKFFIGLLQSIFFLCLQWTPSPQPRAVLPSTSAGN